MNQDEYHHLKDGTRWEKFSHNELQMLRYGLAQIYDTTKDDINNMLKELNAILSPKDTITATSSEKDL